MDKILIGGTVISDISDTDYAIIGTTPGDTYIHRKAGWSAFVSIFFEPVQIEGEYMTSWSEFNENDIDADADGEGDQPGIWNLEISYQATDELNVAARYGGSSEALDIPETQYGGIVTYELFSHTTLALEGLVNEFDEEFCSTGLDSTITGTFNVTTEF